MNLLPLKDIEMTNLNYRRSTHQRFYVTITNDAANQLQRISGDMMLPSLVESNLCVNARHQVKSRAYQTIQHGLVLTCYIEGKTIQVLDAQRREPPILVA